MLKIVLSTLLLVTSAHSLELKIVNPCEKTLILKESLPNNGETIGKISTDIFTKYNYQFEASEFGVAQLLNSPIGIDAMEVISDTVMRAHGWCYSINGEVPELLMNEIVADESIKTVVWFMGYSTYVGNMQTGEHEWIGQCIPTNELATNPFPSYCQQ